jgi:hypothetical protein
VSFGALAFLVIHIVTEILAQRSHAIDSVIPFLSPYRTFYIGLGTISSDLILLIIVTSILRKRFTAHGKAWRWRAIHYGAYLAFVFGVMHGLLAGRTAKPYVDWSYGFAIALTALALVVRVLATSLRSKDRVNAPRGADRAGGGLGYSGTSPLRTAALRMAQAQLGGTVRPMPANTDLAGADPGRLGRQPWAELPAPRTWPASSGPLPALNGAPGPGADSSGVYADPRLTPLAAPVYPVAAVARTSGYRTDGYPYPSQPSRSPAAVGPASRSTWHEPEYDGPPRFVGTPRRHVPQDDLSSYPYSPAGSQLGAGEGNTDPLPRLGTSPILRADSGPLPRLSAGPISSTDSGRLPRSGTGPIPRVGTGPMPRVDTGPLPRAATGPIPRVDSGPLPRAATGPMPRAATGPMPRAATGPMPRTDSNPRLRPGTGTGPVPGSGTGPLPRVGSGPMTPAGTGPWPRMDSGPLPRLGAGPMPIVDSGPMPRAGTGPMPRPGLGPMPRMEGPTPPPGTGPVPRFGGGRPARPGAGPAARPGANPNPHSPAGPGAGPMTAAPPRRSHASDAAHRRSRGVPGRAGGDEWR